MFLEVNSVTTKLDGKIIYWNLSVIMAIKRLHMLSYNKISVVCTYNVYLWARESDCQSGPLRAQQSMKDLQHMKRVERH
jgi:hypothetical protein